MTHPADELAMVEACAKAMGWHTGGLASKVVAYKVSEWAIIAGNDSGGESVYDPLTDDAQAFALISRFKLLTTPEGDDNWIVSALGGHGCCEDPSLHVAIVRCVSALARGD